MPKEVRALLFSLLVVTLAACSLTRGGEQEATAPSDTPTSTPEAEEAEEPETRQADVESIEVLVLESFPVQVNVIASGTLPDACTTLNEPAPRLEGNTFVVNLTATRLPEEVCSQAVVPFDKVIQLDAEGLSAGTYTVSVNGVTGTFTLETDNVVGGEGEPTPTAVAPDADTGGIEGTVWHDLCSVSGGEGDEPLVPSDGCVALEQGVYQANGILEADEPGIAGIVVNLGEGACPADGLDSATTGDDGDYAFADLEPGTYCVSIDALDDNNSSILVPGEWTVPEAGAEGAVGAEVAVTAGDVASDVNFGWDYENLPEPGEEGATEGEATAEGDDCIDAAEFVADVTVQDNEVLPPGFVFTKTWRLANSGTCTWTSDYDLVFAGGDRMGAPQAQPLPRPVAPNQAINLSVQMVAPQINGTYRGDWQLRNADGELFGIPDEITFWVQIVVSAAVPEEGSTIAGLVWSDVCEVTDETPSAGCVDDGEGGFLANGTLDGGEPRIGGVNVALAEGACPATAVTSTTSTDEAGRYSFTGLEPGTYCVFINPEGGNNAGVLGDGTWTYPDVTEETVSLTVEVVANDTASDINFGWDVAAE
ncbi:MAG: NBR1-Ig-like domain-containing protein [Candidatus Promineifilaceae bacterium]|nr:NBR1-Ig-like domain-containing protein [Candidatus Promineifilaceae bacterium]